MISNQMKRKLYWFILYLLHIDIIMLECLIEAVILLTKRKKQDESQDISLWNTRENRKRVGCALPEDSSPTNNELSSLVHQD